MGYAHNIAVLEENTLNLVQITYVSGCVRIKDNPPVLKPSQKDYDHCVVGSKEYRADIAQIFHDKIWDRPASKRKAVWKVNSF